jgi:hypothetical protein
VLTTTLCWPSQESYERRNETLIAPPTHMRRGARHDLGIAGVKCINQGADCAVSLNSAEYC